MSNAKRLYFTLDLEDHRPDDSYPRRYPEITREILAFLSERKIEATVFVLGRLAREEPELIREIAHAGHEIAFHSFSHTHLTAETAPRLRSELRDNKSFLEDLTGEAVLGYRAPAFSLTKASVWAVDVIQEAGFAYSSSVLPVRNPIFGFPGAPQKAFKWPNGLLEIPAPVAHFGPLRLPFLGGFYLRYLPMPLIAHFLRRSSSQQCHWAYCHPHDFDHEERFYKIAGTSFATSMLLWFNRRRTFMKLARVFELANKDAQAVSFASAIEAGNFDDAPMIGADRLS